MEIRLEIIKLENQELCVPKGAAVPLFSAVSTTYGSLT
jgi:hypothetical protein